MSALALLTVTTQKTCGKARIACLAPKAKQASLGMENGGKIIYCIVQLGYWSE
jgi:hypothetical protein